MGDKMERSRTYFWCRTASSNFWRTFKKYKYTTTKEEIKMCLYPKLIRNPRYLPNKKNGYNAPVCRDPRLLWVSVGCGQCIECRTQKARGWQIRLNKELEVHKYAYFCTFTFSEESLDELQADTKTDNNNALAKTGVRRFLERWRRKYKEPLRHWLITELGHIGTERIHVHGIIFSERELTQEKVQERWQYGFCDLGQYCNERSINYIIKYVTKVDNDHKGFEPLIMCSAGLGANYVTNNTKAMHKYKQGESIEYLRLPNGNKVNLPIYYRNKFFTEEEREKLWQDRLDQQKIFVRGIECDISTEEGRKEYMRILDEQQKINLSLGYGDDSINWSKREYHRIVKDINKRQERTKSRSKAAPRKGGRAPSR